MPKPYCANNVPIGSAARGVGGGGVDRARERDAAVRDPERAGGTLLAMTHDEGLSVREAVEWCGSGVKLREVSRLRRLADLRAGGGGKVNARAQ